MTKNRRLVAVIPARSGSKRIPGKNIKEFDGVPMISRTIRTLLEAELFDEIVSRKHFSELEAAIVVK